MTQSDPNKMYVDANNKVNTVGEQPQPKHASAFLQIPLALEKQVNAYVNKLAEQKGIEWESEQEGGVKSIFQSQGCFFIISLEKIEALMKAINNSLSLNEGDMEEIKKNLGQAMDIINGI